MLARTVCQLAPYVDKDEIIRSSMAQNVETLGIFLSGFPEANLGSYWQFFSGGLGC